MNSRFRAAFVTVLRVRPCLLCLWFSLGFGTEARAEPEQPRAADAGDTLQDALAAYEAGDLVRARTLFEAVHKVHPTARTWRALGALAFRQQRYADAIELLEASLSSAVKPLTPELAANAHALLMQARAQLALQPLAEDPRTPLPEGVPSPLEPPASPKPASASDATPATASVATAEAAPAATRATRSRRLRRASYGLFAAAGAAAVVAVVSTGIGIARMNQIEDICRGHTDGQCFASELRALERDKRLELLSGLSIGSTIAAAVSAGTGTLLLLGAWWRDRTNTARLSGLMLQLQVPF